MCFFVKIFIDQNFACYKVKLAFGFVWWNVNPKFPAVGMLNFTFLRFFASTQNWGIDMRVLNNLKWIRNHKLD